MTNLEEKRLKEQKYMELKNTYRYLVNANTKLVDENKDLKRRISDALLFIEDERVKKILEGRIEYEYEEEKDEYMAYY